MVVVFRFLRSICTLFHLSYHPTKTPHLSWLCILSLYPCCTSQNSMNRYYMSLSDTQQTSPIPMYAIKEFLSYARVRSYMGNRVVCPVVVIFFVFFHNCLMSEPIRNCKSSIKFNYLKHGELLERRSQVPLIS